MQEKTTILITGANNGIGLQLAYLYASPDTHLILIARNQERLQQAASACEAKGASVAYQSLDVQDAAALKSCLLEMDAKTPIDLIIANAGVSATLQPHWQPEREQDVAQILGINIQGTINTIQPLLPAMIARKKGQIAIISSLAGLRGLPQSPSYCASKAATRAYGQALRAWLSRYDIRVNVICPGYVATDMIEYLKAPKPFLVSSDKAAQYIKQGLAKNKSCIVFPWQLGILSRLSSLLPESWMNGMLNRVEP